MTEHPTENRFDGSGEGESRATGAPSADPTTGPEPRDAQDISGVDNLIEEGGPLEPGDVTADEVGSDPLAAARQEAAERTADLQRLQAEFVNYKRRVERDRELIQQNAVFAVLRPMLDVLDSIDRAREAGELEGGFKGVAEQLERAVSGLGLQRFGAPGDPFDPHLHEALSHVGTDPEVSVPTAKHVAKAGYRFGDRVIRAAQVLVVDPAEGAADAANPGEPGDAGDAGDGEGPAES